MPISRIQGGKEKVVEFFVSLQIVGLSRLTVVYPTNGIALHFRYPMGKGGEKSYLLNKRFVPYCYEMIKKQECQSVVTT